MFRDDVASPSLWITGRNPGERANISQGEFQTLNSGTTPYGYLMVTNDGATLRAYLDQWVLGSLIANGNSTNAGGRGIAEIRNGEIDVNNIILGRGVSTVSVGIALGWLTLHGGTMAVNNGLVIGQRLNAGNIVGTLALSGGVTTVSGNISDGGGLSTLILDGGTLDMSGNNIGSLCNPIDTLSMASGVLRNVSQINGGANWSKTGSGTLTIEGNQAYTWNLDVQGGKLLYHGAYTGGGLITVQNGATLGGTGSVAALYIASGGTLAPGMSAGVLTTASNVTFEAGATFDVEVLGPLADQYDQLLMSNVSELTLGFATLSVTAPNTLAYGTVFPIISGWGSIDPTTFDSLADGDTFVAGANTFQINYGTLPGYSDDVTLTVVPEPGTLGTMGLVLLAGVLARRRLRR